ncbi:MAG: tetrathionate reductase family octaheme c-type cytochrome [Melioribacteraceae bacterium]|nr:tetrathionate reductase family octaheme c-type cytochrome [Melioribacteraceae bacterium]
MRTKKNIFVTMILVIFVLILVNVFHDKDNYNLRLEKLRQEYAIPKESSIDHSKLPVLQKTFKTPQEVTETCIACHTERHKEVMASSHWNWERTSYISGRGLTSTGKKNVLNNFCIGASSNEDACAKCHIGYGAINNDEYDLTNASNVDCMVCHDNSTEYLKGSAMAGYPDRTVNLNKVAQSVGRPKKDNCGSCHFYSGGGNNVKHGDLEESILSATKDVDVHMAANGMDMVCVDCHTAENHKLKGKLYSISSTNSDRSNCEDCHTNLPHFDEMLNRHTAKIACQTCHIPEYAKVNATKMAWKWSDAGKLKDGQPYHEEDEDGNHTYLSMKGSFDWQKNVTPDYVWFNGTADHYVLGDTIKSVPVQMNTLFGSATDGKSKIIPVKIHKGDQIYDKKYNNLIQPKVFAKEVGDSAYWKDFDWNLAAAAGMKKIGLPYSGEYGFVETEMYWPVNHMVSPKEKSLMCVDCHVRENGRLQNLTGFYLPGRDKNDILDSLGTIMIILAMVGVLAHGSIRFIMAIRKEEYETEIINK